MRFSIIIPMHNCQNTIRKVLNCVQKQSFPSKEFEVICVDDKSKDTTARIVKESKGVKLIKFSQNRGNGRVKNMAVRKAKGEILFFVDDHLYLDKDALLNIDLLFKQYPNISGICGSYRSPGTLTRTSAETSEGEQSIGRTKKKKKFL